MPVSNPAANTYMESTLKGYGLSEVQIRQVMALINGETTEAKATALEYIDKFRATADLAASLKTTLVNAVVVLDEVSAQRDRLLAELEAAHKVLSDTAEQRDNLLEDYVSDTQRLTYDLAEMAERCAARG
jgi:hypothetical protein